MGDPIRALQAREMFKIIKENDLVGHTARVGDYLYNGLHNIFNGAGKGKMLDLRGKDAGTFIAFDCETPKKRDQFLGSMRSKGVNMGASGNTPIPQTKVLIQRNAAGCGDKAVRLRPMLVFGQPHADLLLERAEETFRDL